ncbi:PAS domain-containing protein [Parvibaculum sp.]|uniref:PAS domain-containing protein n=1 Tax=Parvibaculum sp. TaxID=2024848 RepID=UPI003C78A47C
MSTGPNRAWQGAPILPPIALETQLDFEMAEVREGCAYWQAKAAGREMPLHADIRPEEIPRLLPYICLFDIRRSNGTVDIFPRLAGAKFEEVFGSIHNRPLDTVLPPEIVARWKGAAGRLIELRRPLRGAGEVLHQEKSFLRFELVLAPLSKTGAELDMMFLVCQFALSSDRATA